MQITLKQAHIEAAIRDYVAKAGITFPVDSIDFTASRGKDGMTATVEMEDPFLLDPAPSLNPASTPSAVKASASKREVLTAEETPIDGPEEAADTAEVDEAPEAPAPEASPFKSDAAEPAVTKEVAAPKAGVSLFG